MALVKFLGTAGARFVVARQLRSSAGTYIETGGLRVMLDPGPGTLVRCAKSRPPIDATALDAVILTHNHVDHSGDVNVLLDAMTAGGLKPGGALFAPRECLEGDDAVVLRYVRAGLDTIEVLGPDRAYRWKGLSFRTSARHRHAAETYGVKLDLDGATASFLVDTAAFPGLPASYAGSDLLVVNVVRATRARTGPDILHLTLDDARDLLREIRPRKTVLTHFGMTMLRAKPREAAAALGEELGLDVVAASDGMSLRIPEDLG